jgi:hypothetical protein
MRVFIGFLFNLDLLSDALSLIAILPRCTGHLGRMLAGQAAGLGPGQEVRLITERMKKMISLNDSSPAGERGPPR